MTAAIVWEGPDELRPFLVPIGEPVPHPRNARRGDLALIAESLARYGQTRPIVLWKSGVAVGGWIAAGNHTWRAAKERLGWTHIAAVAPELTEEEAFEYLHADNAAADAAGYDDAALLAVLGRLYERGGLAGTGWLPDDVDDLIAKANAVPTAAREEFQGGLAETPEEQEARAERAGGQGEVRQLPLAYEIPVYQRFMTHLNVLGRELGTSGVTATVAAAVDREFREVWGGD